MVIRDSTYGTSGGRAILGEQGPTGRAQIRSDLDTALGVAKSNLAANVRAMPSDYSAYRQARLAFIEAGRALQNRADKLTQRLAELNELEAAEGLPLTEVDDRIRSGPQPVTAADFETPAE